jgi:hypothetical protein
MKPGVSPKPRVTQTLDNIIEPDWHWFIPDQLGFARPGNEGTIQSRRVVNMTARKYAHDQWENVLSSLRENGTLTLDSLELVTALVLARVRIFMSSNTLFTHGLEYYDIDLERVRSNHASADMDSAIRIQVLLQENLGMTPKMRDKVSKRQVTERPARASAVYLKSV